MPKIKELIHPIEGFQHSVNINFDLRDDSKVKEYLPSASALTIINEIVLGTYPKSKDRARLLTGAYGKGKSHLVLHVLALLSKRNKKLFENMLKIAKGIDKCSYSNIIEYIESDKKLLPVLINAETADFRANLLHSLSAALKEAGLANLMPTTFFDMAVQKIEDWRINFPKTYADFEKVVDMSGKAFVTLIQGYDQSRYDQFVKIYPTLTSGSFFNPMEGMDAIKVYDSVLVQLKKNGYAGIYVVYDEFGKFLEGNGVGTSADDIKRIQDFAERCSRAGEDQIHCLFISHKSISNYIGKLSKEKVDAWKAVEGRFTTISLSNDERELYNIITQVLDKNEAAYSKFVLEHSGEFQQLASITQDNEIRTLINPFADYISEKRDIAMECYPLHPYSFLMLPKISELVAQNERTTFTFLASHDRNTVNFFLSRSTNGFDIIEPDYIYDYFEAQFRSEPFGSDIRKHYQTATTAIQKLSSVGNELTVKIVKTISLIYIVNQFETIPPSIDLVYDIYKTTHIFSDISIAIEILKSCGLLLELRFKPHVRLLESSGNDINDMIKQEVSMIEGRFDYKSLIKTNTVAKYFYPTEYNDTREITRYFTFDYLTLNELDQIVDLNSYIKSVDADGIIYAIIVEDELEKQQAEQKISNLQCGRVLFIVPKNPSKAIDVVAELAAVENLIRVNSGDNLLIDELTWIRKDRSDMIGNYLAKNYLKPEKGAIDYYYQGQKEKIMRMSQLSRLLSIICEEVYKYTPTIVNENINKNNLSAPMRTARQRIVSGLLENNLRANLGLSGSQDINVFRSVLVVPGIITDLENPNILENGIDANFEQLLVRIKEFFISSGSEPKCIKDLYSILTEPNHGIGLKKGVIPFYLAVIVRRYKKNITFIYRGKEVPIDADLLISINENPSDYLVQIENWNNDKEQFIARLETMFAKTINKSEREYSSFDYVAKAMQRWFMSLSKLDKQAKKYCADGLSIVPLDKAALQIKNELNRPEVNARELLFDKLAKIYETHDFAAIGKKLEATKQKLDRNIDNYLSWYESKIKDLFKCIEGSSLTSGIKDYFNKLESRTKTHVFVGAEAGVFDSLKSVGYDSNEFIRKLLRSIMGLYLEDFSDTAIELAFQRIEQAKKAIDEYNSKTETADIGSGNYAITYKDEEGAEVVRHFEKGEMSGKAKMLYNDITSSIDEFGQSLTAVEKSQVLLEILKKLCD